MKIPITWEDGESCGIGVGGIECDCGEIDKVDTMSNGEVWTCAKCGKKVAFKWLGMTYIELE